MTADNWIQVAKWLMGGLAGIAAYLLVQPDIIIEPAIKVTLGAFLVFAAYVNPAAIATGIKRGDANA